MGNSKIIKVTMGLLLISSVYADDYQDWLKSESTEYKSYKKTVDEEFTSVLKADWEAFQSMYNPSPYKVKKPLSTPKVKKAIVLPKKEIAASPKVKLRPIVKKVIQIKPKTIVVPTKPVVIVEPIKNLPKEKPTVKVSPQEVKPVVVKEKIEYPKVLMPTSKPQVIAKPVTKPVIMPVVKKDEKSKYKNLKAMHFDFYSNSVEMFYDPKIRYRSNKATSKNIAKFWEYTSKTKWKKLLEQIQDKSKEFNLNGWAEYQFVHKFSQKVYGDENLSNMLTWFILTKLNYDTKVAYGNNKVYLLANVKQKLFQVSFFNIKGKKYYVITPTGKAKSIGRVYTYQGSYPKSINGLSFSMPKEVLFDTNVKEKELSFKYYGEKYVVNTNYSKDLVDFYKSFPQSDFTVYFGASNSKYLSDSILSSLSKFLKNKSEIEAANFLLRFTQIAFKYKTDPDQFGYEKPMFPEEMLYYPYNDCEDRAVMYSYLVENLLGLDVVGVKYSGHLATAVSFNSKVSGNSFKHKSKTYVIADPTYINANVGMPMKQYKNAKFEIID